VCGRSCASSSRSCVSMVCHRGIGSLNLLDASNFSSVKSPWYRTTIGSVICVPIFSNVMKCLGSIWDESRGWAELSVRAVKAPWLFGMFVWSSRGIRLC
jgi:hypothetical protein